MELIKHKFDKNTIYQNWLSNLTYSIDDLLIEQSEIEFINNNSFNSHVFDKLHKLAIRYNIEGSFQIHAEGFAGLNSIETFLIDESASLVLVSRYSILAPIRSTLSEVSINDISEFFVPSQIFKETTFENLRILKMNGNNFEAAEFSNTTFLGAHKTVEELYLRYSKITIISTNAFSKFEKLKILDLVGNELTTLESTFFGNLSNNKNFRIFIYGNLWNCTCSIVFLVDFMADEETALCKEPPELAGHEISQLREICSRETSPLEGM